MHDTANQLQGPSSFNFVCCSYIRLLFLTESALMLALFSIHLQLQGWMAVVILMCVQVWRSPSKTFSARPHHWRDCACCWNMRLSAAIEASRAFLMRWEHSEFWVSSSVVGLGLWEQKLVMILTCSCACGSHCDASSLQETTAWGTVDVSPFCLMTWDS